MTILFGVGHLEHIIDEVFCATGVGTKMGGFPEPAWTPAILGVVFLLHKSYPYSLYRWEFLDFRYLKYLVNRFFGSSIFLGATLEGSSHDSDPRKFVAPFSSHRVGWEIPRNGGGFHREASPKSSKNSRFFSQPRWVGSSWPPKPWGLNSPGSWVVYEVKK